VESFIEDGEELAAKQVRQDADREQIALPGGLPRITT
jgi:hypothetical protein